jgi:hypothetical protein
LLTGGSSTISEDLKGENYGKYSEYFGFMEVSEEKGKIRIRKKSFNNDPPFPLAVVKLFIVKEVPTLFDIFRVQTKIQVLPSLNSKHTPCRKSNKAFYMDLDKAFPKIFWIRISRSTICCLLLQRNTWNHLGLLYHFEQILM